MQKVHIASTFGQYDRAQNILVLQVCGLPRTQGLLFLRRILAKRNGVIGKPKNTSSLLVPFDICEAFP